MAFDAETIEAIERVAAARGLPALPLRVVAEVESGGKAFVTLRGEKLPLILFEGHVFYRRLAPELRERAVRRGLAGPRWGDVPYPAGQAARYRQLARAAKIDAQAAHAACSWGVGQVLGENAEWLGYASPVALAEKAKTSVEGQVDLMVDFIFKRGLVDELERLDWRGFARLYNGPGQVDHYAGVMARTHARLGGAEPAGDPVVLRVGARGEAVAELQRGLRALGFHLTVDGDFGPATKRVVTAFQAGEGLAADGVAGPETLARIETLRGADRTAHL